MGVTTLAGTTTLPQRKAIERVEGIIKKKEMNLIELREVLELLGG